MHGLAGIADIMRPHAQIAQDQHLAHGLRAGIRLFLGRRHGELAGVFLRRHVPAQQREILHQCCQPSMIL
jgi:hypothetical protein